ncbi:DDE superfamily endonuclease [Popillia japonica]|uniref:DDE superfamily endonuclease n=1 Tax=Popillia japonica TaxID=7064 RepID=A0AAW1JBQ3_POPJA
MVTVSIMQGCNGKNHSHSMVTVSIMQGCKHKLKKKDTTFRTAICPEERVLITLRYYATGCTFKTLSYNFLRGHTSIRNVVVSTSLAIWNVLQPHFLPIQTAQQWKKIADRYYELWNLRHCLGSVDGKHIRIKAPPKSGSAFYNYRQYFSIVSLATADADGLFLTIDVGEYGRNSDGRVFRESAFGKALINKQIDLPGASHLPGEPDLAPFPYYFVGDEAFPLMENLMRPMRPYPRRQCRYYY